MNWRKDWGNVVVIWFWWSAFEFWVKQHLVSGWRSAPRSEQSSKKQKEKSCTGHWHGPCKRVSFRTRGSCTGRGRRFSAARVWCTDRAEGACSLFSVARVRHTGRAGEACALISGIARGVLINTDRVDCLACTGLVGSARGVFAIFGFSMGRADWHGSGYFSARVEQFSSSEVGNLIFSQFSGFVVI